MAANKLRGLSPVDRAPQAGQSLGGRPDVQAGIPQVAFRPTTTPADTKVTPLMDGGAGSDFVALAQGLAQLNPQLDRAFTAFVANEEQTTAELAAGKIAGMTHAEAAAATARGDISEWDNPWYRATYKKLLGQRRAADYEAEVSQAYLTEFDRDAGDIDQFLADKARAALEGVSDKFEIAGFTQLVGGINQKLRAAHWQGVNDRVTSEARDNAYAKFSWIVSDGLERGATPAEINANIRAQYKDIKDGLFIPTREQDRIVLTLAAKLAEDGQKDVVSAILDTPREGGIPPISSVRELVGPVAKIKEAASAAWQKKQSEAQFDQRVEIKHLASRGELESAMVHQAVASGYLTAAEAEAYTVQNATARDTLAEQAAKAEAKRIAEAAYQQQFDTITSGGLELMRNGALLAASPQPYRTKEGGEAEWSREKVIEETVNQYLKESAVIARKNGETPEQTLNRDLAEFLKNGVVNPQWSGILTNGYASASNATIDPSKASSIPAPLSEAYGLFLKMKVASPELLGKHIKDDRAWDFYETMNVAQEFMGQSMEQAYATALAVTKTPGITDSQPFTISPKELQKKLKDMGGDYTRVAPTISRLGRLYMSMGLDKKTALDKAVERFEATNTIIRGNFIPVNRIGQPPNFADLLNGFVEEFAAANAEKLGLDADELTVEALNGTTNSYRIVRTTDGAGLDVKIPGARFAMEDLIAWGAERDKALRAKIADEHAHRFDPWFDNGIFSAGPFVNGNEEAKAVGEVRDKARAEQRQRLDALRGRFGTYSDRNGR